MPLTGALMPVVARLDHIALAAENTASLLSWYQKVLGLAVVLESPPKPSGQKAYLLGLPTGAGESSASLSRGMMIELFPKQDLPRHQRQPAEAGFDHLAFSTSDFDGALAHLKSQNIQHGDIAAAFGGGRVITLPDPEGNLIQIVERK